MSSENQDNITELTEMVQLYLQSEGPSETGQVTRFVLGMKEGETLRKEDRSPIDGLLRHMHRTGLLGTAIYQSHPSSKKHGRKRCVWLPGNPPLAATIRISEMKVRPVPFSQAYDEERENMVREFVGRKNGTTTGEIQAEFTEHPGCGSWAIDYNLIDRTIHALVRRKDIIREKRDGCFSKYYPPQTRKNARPRRATVDPKPQHTPAPAPRGDFWVKFKGGEVGPFPTPMAAALALREMARAEGGE